jgi:hypothetical protein
MKVCSIFSQVLKLFSRGEFEKAVKEHQAERHARGFTSWGQFVAMLFCQVGRAHSLREICGGLACCEGQLMHLGVPVAPKKSTLAYANENRPWELYQTVFQQTYGKCQELVSRQGGRKKFRFKNKLASLDGSIIDLSVSMFDWAKFRWTKGAIKRHLLLGHDGCWRVHGNQTARIGRVGHQPPAGYLDRLSRLGGAHRLTEVLAAGRAISGAILIAVRPHKSRAVKLGRGRIVPPRARIVRTGVPHVDAHGVGNHGWTPVASAENCVVEVVLLAPSI